MVGSRFMLPAALILVASAGARPAGRVTRPTKSSCPPPCAARSRGACFARSPQARPGPARSRGARGSSDDGEFVHAIAKPIGTRAMIFERA